MSPVSEEQRQDAISFLSELARRANAEEVLGEHWWMSLQEMLHDGWAVGNPLKEFPAANTMSILRLVEALHDAEVLAPGLEPDGVRITVELLEKMQADGFRFQLPQSKAS